MGQPARRIQTPQAAPRAARLRLVDTPPARAPRPRADAATRTRARVEEARARSLFTGFLIVFLCAVALGGARVTLTSRAAEFAVGESRLAADIKQQRVAVDQLEVDRSALSTPSRIAGIAATSMSMGEPKSVKYISSSDVDTTDAGALTSQAADVTGASALQKVVDAVVELSAGEAQSLLVGDLGLAGSR